MVYAIDSENRNATFFGRCSCRRISAKKRPFSCIFMDFHDFQFVNMKDFMFFSWFFTFFSRFLGTSDHKSPNGMQCSQNSSMSVERQSISTGAPGGPGNGS